MHYAYLIKSASHPDQRYIGITSDLKSRWKAHNEGQSPNTAKYKPWKIVTYLAFSDKSKAVEFERYLKSGSGQAFANKDYGDQNQWNDYNSPGQISYKYLRTANIQS